MGRGGEEGGSAGLKRAETGLGGEEGGSAGPKKGNGRKEKKGREKMIVRDREEGRELRRNAYICAKV